MIGEQEEWPIADTQSGNFGVEGVESPYQLGSQHVPVVRHVTLEFRRADVQVCQLAQGFAHFSTTASASISTRMSCEINRLTSTMLVAGRMSLKNSP
jgi:hypothetical protein